MDISYQPAESNDLLTELMPTEDQLFLLYFIMGSYFGPDLKWEMVKKSALQRMAEGLPPYNSNQLAKTHIKSVEVERVYYHVLRKADQSVSVKLPLLHHFLAGNIHSQIPELHIMYPQFPDLFPSKLHPQSRSKDGYKVIKNIVFINSPDVNYIEPANVERFKRLTGLDDFDLSRDDARTHNSTVGCGGLYNVSVHETDYKTTKKMRRVGDIMDTANHFHDVHVVAPISSVSRDGRSMPFNFKPLEEFEPAMIFLPSRPNINEWQNIVAATRSGFGLTGCAAIGQVGSVIGLIDIGECKNSYIFRVSLPGVKRDGKQFSCVVEIDGKVLIKGVTTTGEKTVYRHSQAFEMQTQNLCPPGKFSISFQLPGPVDPLKFSGKFGTDGILEGIVLKDVQRKL